MIYQVPTTCQAPSCPLHTLPHLGRSWDARNRSPTQQFNGIKLCVPPQQEGSAVSQGPRLFPASLSSARGFCSQGHRLTEGCKRPGMAPESAPLNQIPPHLSPPLLSAQWFRSASHCCFLHIPDAGQPPISLGLGLDSLPEEWREAGTLCSRCQVAPSNQSLLPAHCCNQLADLSPG